MRSKKIEAALDWAYRQGYSDAKGAALEYAQQAGAIVTLHDLGTYGYSLTFPDADTWTFSRRVLDVGKKFLLVEDYRGSIVGYVGTHYDAEITKF